MSITSAQQADALFKASLGVPNPKPLGQFFEQPGIAAPVVLPDSIWAEAGLIPKIAPTLGNQETSGVVKKWVDLPLTLVAGSTQAYTDFNLKNIIPFNFGDGTSYNYTIKGSDNSAIPFGTNDWVLQNNVLTFYAGISGLIMPPKITFYEYVGKLGLIVATTTPVYPSSFKHIQNIAATEWLIVHNMNTYPNVVIVDSAGSSFAMFGDVEYIDMNTVRLIFSAGFAGEAYLS